MEEKNSGRVIKFRAFYDGAMYDVTEIMWSDETAYLVEQESWGDPVNGQTVGFNHIELMQFTGLTNNGQDWYEGDILENDSDWYQVAWDAEQARWEAVGVKATHESSRFMSYAAAKRGSKGMCTRTQSC